MNRESKERRKGPDFWIKFLKTLAAISWIFMFFILVLLEIAKPEFETFFDRFYNLQLRTTWNLSLAKNIYYAMFAGLFISATGLLISAKRYRRREDMYPVSLILIGTFSIAGIILYSIYF